MGEINALATAPHGWDRGPVFLGAESLQANRGALRFPAGGTATPFHVVGPRAMANHTAIRNAGVDPHTEQPGKSGGEQS
jgi:hypothetical protein